MKNSNNTRTQTTSPKLHVCEGCKQTGNMGAEWLLYVTVDGKQQVKLVHKPCGALLMKSAPQGVKTELVPTRQLRERWRTERMAKSFWGDAFQGAKPLKPKPAPAVREQEPVLMTVTVPPPMTVAQAA